jgi:hypothetical protein
MSKGYLIFAQGAYVDMAQYLADSIQRTQSAIKDVHIVADLEGDVMVNRTKLYDLTPFDETVILDADMIFLEDVSHWWKHFEKYNLLITNKVKTYRSEWVTHSPYRKTFISNNLSNCYSAFSYFKKHPEAENFFKLLKIIVGDWETYTTRFAPENRQTRPSIDLAMAIAVKVLDLHPFSPLDFPTFTHMKSGCQGWNYYSEDWRVHLDIHKTELGLRLGNYLQTGILHYVNKDFIDELRSIQ